MLQTDIFTKTRREPPKDETAENAKLLIRAGYIHKEMAGVYSFLPLGLKTFNKIVSVIRSEMNAIGGQEISLTALQTPEPWQASGRWSDEEVDIWFKTKMKNGAEVGLSNTHEEPLTKLMTHHINSYKDLPVYPYQFQTKFRNELRAKSGLMRTREFVMKDMYSFNQNKESFRKFYELAASAYLKIFDKLGIGERTYRTYASGGSFSKFSDEFQTVSKAGEDIIYIDKGQNIAINKEVYTDEVIKETGFNKENAVEEKAIEVGNIFPLGTKYSSALGLDFIDEYGESKPVIMGSYGIGPARVMGAIVETLADEKGIVWPPEIAPFKIHLLKIGKGEDLDKKTEEMYNSLTAAGFEALYDNRDVSAGEKFKDADLMGMPYQVIMGEKTLESGNIEFVRRSDGEKKEIKEEKLEEELKEL